MKVSICGLGAVGQAHYDWLKDLYSIEVYDPPKGYNKIFIKTNCKKGSSGSTFSFYV